MATELGKFLRRLRIDRDELLKDMADKLNIASSTLSSIESGRRNPPVGFKNTMISQYGLADAQIEELETAIMQSKNEVTMRTEGMPMKDRELAISFARKFENLSENDKERLRRILDDK